MGGVRWYFLVAKQYSLARGSLGVEINGQCWIPRSSAYKQLRGRYSQRVQGVAGGQHDYVLPSCAPDSTSFLTHGQSQQEPCYLWTEPVARREGGGGGGGQSGLPVRDRGCHQCRSRRSNEATRGRRSEKTKVGRECGSATRGRDGSATRGGTTTSRRDKATRGWRSERTTIGQECGGATRRQDGGETRGDATTSRRDEAMRGRCSERRTIGQECGGATRG